MNRHPDTSHAKTYENTPKPGMTTHIVYQAGTDISALTDNFALVVQTDDTNLLHGFSDRYDINGNLKERNMYFRGTHLGSLTPDPETGKVSPKLKPTGLLQKFCEEMQIKTGNASPANLQHLISHDPLKP